MTHDPSCFAELMPKWRLLISIHIISSTKEMNPITRNYANKLRVQRTDCYRPVSQSCALARNEQFSGPLDNQTWQTECSIGQSALVRVRKPNFEKLLLRPAVCMSSLIVQWPTRNFHCQLLRMTVRLAYTSLCYFRVFYSVILDNGSKTWLCY